MEEKPSCKMIPVILAALAASVLVGAQYSNTAAVVSSSNVATYNQWGTVQNCSYQIFKAGSTTYARSCNTGAVDYSGTSTATVINSAITALAATGGKVFVKQGTYTLTSSINLADGITLEGESHNIGNLIGESLGIGVVFIISGNIVGISSVDDEDVTLKYISITGNRPNETIVTGAHNISFDDCTVCWIDHISSTDAKAAALYIEDGFEWTASYLDLKTSNEAGLYMRSTDDCHVHHANVGSNVGYGVWIRDTGGCEITNVNSYLGTVGFYLHNTIGVRLIDSRANANDLQGIYIHKSIEGRYGTENLISNNGIYQNGLVTNRAGILIQGEAGMPTGNNTIIGNMFVDIGVPRTQTYAIQESGESAGNMIIGNMINACTNEPTCITLVPGSGTIVRDNKNFVTENTVASDTFTINATGLKTLTTAHGLHYTPDMEDCSLTVLEVTNVDDWAYNLLKVDLVDSINVVAKINVSTASATAGATAKIGVSCIRA